MNTTIYEPHVKSKNDEITCINIYWYYFLLSFNPGIIYTLKCALVKLIYKTNSS